ncbi:class I SAM-dependent methyltransferase [Amphiplicatus metriothermophilus]|uniref:Nodulation-related protein NoeA n=1 Tax=Amphiplicatus metriothermophilus TaxID=1519374 RepID=A0A239PUC2_9PROT|nr:class I SAM-dependent methyltransferase [Amphiplicatus metriothermophilus]MBB5519491.1 ribosomal protein L11 methylase PrmA [Amphiplicatus metriothermophilus]SNT73728.1 nodulation-related protein NoeA [Amphiplicatus metriothermophilus]
MKVEPASFRDPAGRIFYKHGRVFRAISDEAVNDFIFSHSNAILKKLIAEGGIIESFETPAKSLGGIEANWARIVEHPKLPFISYPYEWSFSLLQRAALHHLDLQMDLLPAGVSLSDATAYNVQFVGVNPIFIDSLSFRKYVEGEYWTAHRQFCQQFLNPLLLCAYCGVAHNEWFRGAVEGIATESLARLMPWRRRFSWRVLAHVILPAALQKRDAGAARESLARPFPRHAYLGMLKQLRAWIEGLTPKGARNTIWADYAHNNSYQENEYATKADRIASFASRVRPRLMLDFGCNTGEFSEIALKNGAKSVVGFDFDHGALEGAYRRAVDRDLEFLPLHQDAANPSPGSGWRGAERADLQQRCENADGLIALAFIHHLAIGRNIPLDQLTDWLVGLAPRGIIEFTPKADPMVQRLLSLRKDIFPDYTLERFASLVSERARIVARDTVTSTGRTLFEYELTCSPDCPRSEVESVPGLVLL